MVTALHSTHCVWEPASSSAPFAVPRPTAYMTPSPQRDDDDDEPEAGAIATPPPRIRTRRSCNISQASATVSSPAGLAALLCATLLGYAVIRSDVFASTGYNDADVPAGMAAPPASVVRDTQAPPPFGFASIFGPSMVLQRERRIIVWGWGPPGSLVLVAFDGANAGGGGAAVEASGAWRIELPPKPAGGPHTLSAFIRGRPRSRIVLTDVAMGDVYLVGGQSNAEFGVSADPQAKAAILHEFIAAPDDDGVHVMDVDPPASETTSLPPKPDNKSADFGDIRLFSVGQGTYASVPLREFRSVERTWARATPGSLRVTAGPYASFSALGYTFGVELARLRRAAAGRGGSDTVAIGLVSVNWGGTSILQWMPPAALTAAGHPPPVPTRMMTSPIGAADAGAVRLVSPDAAAMFYGGGGGAAAGDDGAASASTALKARVSLPVAPAGWLINGAAMGRLAHVRSVAELYEAAGMAGGSKSTDPSGGVYGAGGRNRGSTRKEKSTLRNPAGTSKPGAGQRLLRRPRTLFHAAQGLAATLFRGSGDGAADMATPTNGQSGPAVTRCNAANGQERRGTSAESVDTAATSPVADAHGQDYASAGRRAAASEALRGASDSRLPGIESDAELFHSSLWNAMVAPLAYGPIAMRGVLWWQVRVTATIYGLQHLTSYRRADWYTMVA